MPNPSATPTPITPPRVPFIDARTGLIDRAWYQFFLSLYRAADTVVNEDIFNFNNETLLASYDAALQALAQEVQTQPTNELGSLQQQIHALQQEIQSLPSLATGYLQQQLDDLRQEIQTLPKVDTGTVGSTGSITLAKITLAGADGALTFQNGLITAFTAPT